MWGKKLNSPHRAKRHAILYINDRAMRYGRTISGVVRNPFLMTFTTLLIRQERIPAGEIKIAVDKQDLAYYVGLSYNHVPAKAGACLIETENVMSSIVKVWWLLAALLLTSAALSAETAPSSSQSPQGDPDDVYWDSTIANFNGGLNGPVTALTVYDGKLIVGGDFTTAGGIAVNHIAAWDGQSWSPLGTEVDTLSPILTIYNGRLIAGCDYGARAWDGFSWSQLGSGIDGLLPGGIPWGVDPIALTVMNDTLFAAWNATITTGDFPYTSTNSVGVIMSWDGTSWSHYADAPNGVANKGLVGYHGRLFWSPSVTRSAWYSEGVGSGIAGSYGGAMEVCKDRILMSFTDYDCESFFEMNRCYWETMLTAQGDTDATVLWFDYRPTVPFFPWDAPQFLSFGIYDGTVILGGCFPGGNIARLSGSSWLPLGSGVSGQSILTSVSAIAAYNGRLIVGGNFATAGGKYSPNIAMWTKRYLQCGDADGSGEVNLVDIVYTVNWMFANGPAPVDEAAGDYNCDDRPNIADAVYLINYIFRGGPQPCAGCK